MPSKKKYHCRRRNFASPRNRLHAPISNNFVNVTDPYRSLQEELDTIWRLKFSCITREAQTLENLFLEFVATYKTIHRSLRRHFDNLSSIEPGGLAALLTQVEIHRVCEDGATFIDTWFLPLAQSPDDRVFLLKSAADLRKCICMAYGVSSIQTRLYSHMPFKSYAAALRIALESLNPANSNRLGLTLNFALFYHEVLEWDQHACHLAKFGFDEATGFIDTFPEYDIPRDSFVILGVLKECMISWTS